MFCNRSLAVLVVILFVLGCDSNTPASRTSWVVDDTTAWLGLGLDNVSSSGETKLRRFGDYLYAPTGDNGIYRLDLYNGPSTFEYFGHQDSSRAGPPLQGCEGNSCRGGNDILITSKGTVLVAHRSGISRLENGGSSYAEIPLPSRIGAVEWLIESANDHLLGAHINGGIILSVDDGLTWELVNANGVISIGASPSAPNVVWATQRTLFGTGGVYRTQNAGETWTFLRFPDGFEVSATSIALPIADENSAIVAMSCDGYYRTDNSGGEWAFSVLQTCPNSMEAGSTNEVLFAGGINREADLAFIQSTDGGLTWNRISRPDPREDNEHIGYLLWDHKLLCTVYCHS